MCLDPNEPGAVGGDHITQGLVEQGNVLGF